MRIVTSDLDLRHIEIHGHRVGYRTGRFRAGDRPGPRHGRQLGDVALRAPPLAERFTVVAPDLVGHGESASRCGDYSLGAFASGIRDFLLAWATTAPPSSVNRSAAGW